MKKKVIEFILELGCDARYCGKTKTLYIRWHRYEWGGLPKNIQHISMTDVHMEVLKKFGYGLPFRLA